MKKTAACLLPFLLASSLAAEGEKQLRYISIEPYVGGYFLLLAYQYEIGVNLQIDLGKLFRVGVAYSRSAHDAFQDEDAEGPSNTTIVFGLFKAPHIKNGCILVGFGLDLNSLHKKSAHEHPRFTLFLQRERILKNRFGIRYGLGSGGLHFGVFFGR